MEYSLIQGDTSKEKKYTGMTVAPPPKSKPVRRPEGHQSDDKAKNNPLAQPPQKRLNPNRHKDKDKDKDKNKDGGGGSGTVRPAKNFQPDKDVEKLHEAMTGLGTDEAAVMEVITSKNNEQRQQLRKKFQEKYQKVESVSTERGFHIRRQT